MNPSTVTALLFISMASLHYNLVAANPEPASYNLFTCKLLRVLREYLSSKQLSTRNIAFSTVGLNTTWMLLYLGEKYKGVETSHDLRKVLGNNMEMHKDMEHLIAEIKEGLAPNNSAKPVKAVQGYIDEIAHNSLTVSKLYDDYFFKNHMDVYDFQCGLTVGEDINTWVQKSTRNKITHCLEPTYISGNTSRIVVNTIYFKAKWLKPFMKTRREGRSFYVDQKRSAYVEFMENFDNVKYAKFPEYNASAFDIPFEDSDISLLFMWADENEHLRTLENGLINEDLNHIVSRMQKNRLRVVLPKFHMKLTVDLQEPLSHFHCLSQSSTTLGQCTSLEARTPHIPKITQNIFLEINEEGIQAAAATYDDNLSKHDNFTFYGPYAILFFVRDAENVYFAGRMEKYA